MISIVVPAYNEEENIDLLCAQIAKVLDATRIDWEIVIADDGSRDGTWARVTAMNAADSRIWGVRLSRNFGHQSALLAGLSAARGAAVISMDADLQHPAEVIPSMIEKWNEGYQIVHSVRHDAENLSAFKRTTSKLYYKLFSFLSGVAINPGSADFRLLDRKVLDEILRFREEGLFLRGVVHWVGYATTTVEFDSADRHAGTTKYTFRKMLRLAWQGISSFSLVPLRLGIVIGLVSSALAFLSMVYAIVEKWAHRATIPGWASSVAIVSFLFGVLFVFLAILAEYVGRILVEVRGRPRFLVRETTRPRRVSNVAAAQIVPRRRSTDIEIAS